MVGNFYKNVGQKVFIEGSFEPVLYKTARRLWPRASLKRIGYYYK